MPPAPSLSTVGGVDFTVGYAGQIASDPFNAVIESRNNESATAIEYGAPVCRGVAVAPGAPGIGNCKPCVSGGKVIGIAVRQLSEANAAQAAGVTAVVNYAQNKTVPIMKDGWIWCLTAEAVAEGDDVVGIVSGNGLGSAQTGAADGTTRLAFPADCKWEQSIGSGNIALVRVSIAG